jgi:hypothetical protein
MYGYGSLIMKYYKPVFSNFCGPLLQASSYSYWDTADFVACLLIYRGRPNVYIHPLAQYTGLVLLYRPFASVPHS